MATLKKITKEDVQKVIQVFRQQYNYDFSEYALQSFSRRIEHILVSYNLANIDALFAKLRGDQNLVQRIVNDITVNTTELFRDPDIWLNLRRNVLPGFKNSESINIWHAGCSSGEEVYSMLILLNEMGMLEKAKVFATDINTDILTKAKQGVFNKRMHHGYFHSFDTVIKVNPLNFEESVDIPYEKYFDFDKQGNSFQVKDFLREKVTFRKHNLVEGNVFYKFDLIFCRNVIIYFNTELQNRVITLFYESLFNSGMLLIGAHENISYLPIGSKYENKIMKGLYFKKH